MRSYHLAAILASILLTGCETAPKDGGRSTLPPTDGTTSSTSTDSQPLGAKLNKQLMSAIDQMQGDDARARDEAFTSVTAVLQKNASDVAMIQAVIGQIQEQMTQRLTAMLATNDEEARQRLCTVLEFNEAFAAFCIDMLNQPPETRAALLGWSSDDRRALLVGRAYSRNTDLRGGVCAELAKEKSDEADFLLAKLVLDESREVAMRAIDAAGDRTASERILDALWDKAVKLPVEAFYRNYGGGVFKTSRFTAYFQKTIYVRGRAITIADYNYQYNAILQDSTVAADVLVEVKLPSVEKRLASLFAQLGEMRGDNAGNRFRIFSPNYGQLGTTLTQLCAVYKPPELVPFLLRGIAGTATDGYDTSQNGQVYRYSSRIDLMGLLVQYTEQDREVYKLTKLATWGNRFMLAGSIKEEEEAAKKLMEWWKENHKKYGAEDAKLDPLDAGSFSGRGSRDW